MRLVDDFTAAATGGKRYKAEKVSFEVARDLPTLNKKGVHLLPNFLSNIHPLYPHCKKKANLSSRFHP